MINHVHNDGGRAEAGHKGTTRDCVVRAIAIATETPYQAVCDLVVKYSERERVSKRKRGKSHPLRGVYIQTVHKIMVDHFNWEWVPTMKIGSGCKVHLRQDELPTGRLVVRLSRHSAAVIDGVLHDTHDCSRDGTRCVYGYFKERVV